jgi:DNA-binding HxlR family transcriptional regulator
MSTLPELLHHRWVAPVLAELDRTAGSRFVTLTNRIGVGRESLRRTLAALIDCGLVARNPGYGHPLRPEYVLTQRGARVAPVCADLLAGLRELGVENAGLKKWSLPVVLALGGPGRRRFSALQERLREITARALALALKDVTAAGLVERAVTDGYPPASVYSLTSAGARLLPVLRRLEAALEEPPPRPIRAPLARTG